MSDAEGNPIRFSADETAAQAKVKQLIAALKAAREALLCVAPALDERSPAYKELVKGLKAIEAVVG